MKLLLDNFGHFLDAPNGIQKLRDMILQSAVSGKLVPQDPNDEPASVLLKKIKTEKEKLIKEKKIKKSKPLSPIEKNEMPFEIPSTWQWCRIGSLYEVTSSKRIHARDYESEGVPFFRSKEIGELGRGDFISTKIFISRKKYEQLKGIPGFPQPSDLMLASIGASIGNNWICDGREFYYKDGNITKLAHHSLANMKYLQNFMGSHVLREQVTSGIAGSAYNALTIIKIKGLLFPLPPLEEQNTIVTAVEKLLKYCDKLENQIKKSAKSTEKLMQSVIQEAFE